MKNIIIILALFLTSSLLYSQDSNYDAVYQKLTKTYTLNVDGSMDYQYSKEMKLQTYRSFHNLYGETFIVYDPAYQEVKINKVQTIMADGRKVNAPANAFNEVLPGFAANAPVYNGLREMVVTHPGTERGATIFIDYTIHTKKGYFPVFMGVEVMAEQEPVKDLTLKIRVPSSVKLNVKGVYIDVVQAIANENFNEYTWILKDVPAISVEENQKGWNELYSRIFFSTASNREALYTSFVSQPAFSYSPDAGMKKFVADILAANKEPFDIILKIQEKVVNDVRLWPVPLRYTGFKSRSASETWKSNGGTLTEKAILMVALLKEAGISTDLAGVVKTSNFDVLTGTLLDLDDYIVIARAKELEPMYLSAGNLNAQSLKYGLPGRLLVIFHPGSKTEIQNMEEYKNKINLISKFVLNDKKQLEGEVSGTFYKNSAPWLTQLRDQVKMKNFFTGGVVSSDLKELKVNTTGPDEGYAKYTVVKENSFRKDSGFYYYTLPSISSGIDSWGLKLLPTKRLTSLEIPSEMEESYEFTLTTGMMNLFSNGKNTSIKNKCGSFKYEVKQDGEKLTVKKSISLTKRIIAPEDYSGFKDLMDNWNSNKTREIVLTGTKS